MGDDERSNQNRINEAQQSGVQGIKDALKKQKRRQIVARILVAILTILHFLLKIFLIISVLLVAIAAIINFLENFLDNDLKFKNVSVVWDYSYTKSEFVEAVKNFSEENVYTASTDISGELSSIDGENGYTYKEGFDTYFLPFAGDFYDVCTAWNLDPAFVFSIAVLESAFGTSTTFTITNAYDRLDSTVIVDRAYTGYVVTPFSYNIMFYDSYYGLDYEADANNKQRNENDYKNYDGDYIYGDGNYFCNENGEYTFIDDTISDDEKIMDDDFYGPYRYTLCESINQVCYDISNNYLAEDGEHYKDLLKNRGDFIAWSIKISDNDDDKTIIDTLLEIIDDPSKLLTALKKESIVEIISSVHVVGSTYGGVQTYGQEVYKIMDMIFGDLDNNGVMSLSEYIRQFSHSTDAPQSTDGKYYLVYNDTRGWATVGTADIQLASHIDKFDIQGKVLENGKEKTVDSLADYINSKLSVLGGDATTQFPQNADIEGLEIYIEKAIVDPIGTETQSFWYNFTLDNIEGLNLSTQQVYALTAIVINFGDFPRNSIGQTFKEVYLEGLDYYEANSWEHNRYIWDNWWSHPSVQGGSAGHVKGRDAQFETYVKGVYKFNPIVFSRTEYKYFTQQQVEIIQSTFDPTERLTLTVTRDRNDTAHEEEIFTYEEHSSNKFLETAHECWQLMCTDYSNYTYGFVHNGVYPPNNVGEMDCSLYVSWVINCCVGNFSYLYTEPLKTYDWSQYGWEVIDVAKDEDISGIVQPGDIVVRSEGGGAGGHTCIVVEIDSSYNVFCYDCGSSLHWQNNPNCNTINRTGFMQSGRPGVIIRTQ